MDCTGRCIVHSGTTTAGLLFFAVTEIKTEHHNENGCEGKNTQSYEFYHAIFLLFLKAGYTV